MAGFTKTSTCVISIVAVLVAYLYSSRQRNELTLQLDAVLDGLLRAEKKVHLDAETRVAVGFGSCLDVITDAIKVLDGIGAEAPNRYQHTNNINTRQELEEIFAYFFRHGAAAERFIGNDTLFTSLTESAKKVSDTRYVIGGNAPVMAGRFHKEGCKVMLGAQMSTILRTQVDDDIQVVGEDLSEDDIHILMEYSKGRKWGKYTAPRANRFIVHSDINNPTLASLDSFADELALFSPSLLVIGGIQMMDNFPFSAGEREKHLSELSSVLATIPKETKIHFEMASFAEEACLQDVVKHVVSYSDSLGMNEQELPNLHSILSNGSVTLISDPYPRVATTLDQMRAVYKTLNDQVWDQWR